MKEIAIYSFDPNMTEQEKTEIVNELNQFYDEVNQKELDEHYEREYEAREAYRSMCSF